MLCGACGDGCLAGNGDAYAVVFVAMVKLRDWVAPCADRDWAVAANVVLTKLEAAVQLEDPVGPSEVLCGMVVTLVVVGSRVVESVDIESAVVVTVVVLVVAKETSQNSPLHSGAQLHQSPVLLLWHIPCLHGCMAHFTASSHVAPACPIGHTQAKLPGEFMQVASGAQGCPLHSSRSSPQ